MTAVTVDNAQETVVETYRNECYNPKESNFYYATVEDELCDCIIITDDNDWYQLNSRFIEHRCPILIPTMQFDEAKQKYTIYTAITIDIIKNIFKVLKYNTIDVEDWLQLEQILKVANDWNLKDVQQCVVRKMIADMNEENCISVWQMCVKFLPTETQKVFEYVLYTVNAAVNSGRNLDFFCLSYDQLYEILSADMLNINNEMDVWYLLRKWILADRKIRLPFYRYLLKSIRSDLLSDQQKDEIKKFLTRIKMDINGNSMNWSISNAPRIQRDLLLAFGGWEKNGPSSAVEVLDVNGDQWRRVGTFEDQRKVAYHECLVIDKKLYVIGGFEGTQYFNTVRCYDGEIKKWIELAPMHHARCYISACEINGTIIVAGGSDGRSRLRTAEIYDVQKNQWTKIRSMVQRRSDAAACSLAGKMYIAGGYTGETVLQTVEMYTPETDIWTEIAHMSTPRSGLACVADEDFILIAGGFDGVNRLNSAEILRVGSAHTVNIEPMPIPRSNFAMCKMGKYFYAVGGYNTSVTKSVVRFDGKKWERICDLSTARSALRVVLLKGWPEATLIFRDSYENSKYIMDESTQSSTESQESIKERRKNYVSLSINDDLD